MIDALRARRWPPFHWSLRDWLITGLGALLIISLPVGLSDAQWLRVERSLWIAALWGALSGLALAWIARRTLAAAVLILALGAAFITLAESRALPPLQPAVRELIAGGEWAASTAASAAQRWLQRPDEDVPPDPPVPAPQMPEWQAALERLRLYQFNLQAGWPPDLRPRRWQHGQVLLESLLGLLVWCAAGIAAWSLRGPRSAWGALGAALALLGISTYFSERGWLYLALDVFAGLLLAGDLALRRLESRWGADALYDWLQGEWWVGAGVITLLAVTGMSAALGVTDPEFRQRISDLLEPPPEPAAARSNRPREERDQGPPPGVLPREHLLGTGPDLAETTAMAVHTPGSAPAQFYWRSGSYATYTGRGWLFKGTPREVGEMLPLWPESEEPPPGFVALRQSFRLSSETTRIYAAGRPVRLSLPATGIWLDTSGQDLIAVESEIPQAGYEVLSWVPVPAPDDLRGAEGPVPDWAAEAYLTLPEALPARVARLAEEVTAGAPTRYDRALALQDYLRTYEYSLDLPDLPADHDLVDYFLFDLRRGYCDYYASAMIVMARSLSIPARLAVGYRTGTYDPETGAYRVSMADAHSWPELYFTGYGWIPFEPTGGVPALRHGLPDDWYTWEPPVTIEEPEWVLAPVTPSLRINWRVVWPVAAALGVTGAALGQSVARRAIRRRRQREMPAEGLIAALYGELREEARRLGVPLSDSQTPYELLPALLDELEQRADRAPRWTGRWQARLAGLRPALHLVIEGYVTSRYSPHQPSRSAALAALQKWDRAARELALFRWLGRLLSPLGL